ncbi:MAG: bifunctional folylpolyglutamate synthase/dihydrofolate synthase, partial [Pseudomonadota bacterium]
ITPIALDHRAILGNTVAQIAYKKAGIIKSERPVVSARQTSDAAGVISEEAFAKSAPLYVLSPDDLEAVSGPIALVGPHQRENAALAAKALKVWDSGAIDQASVRAGLKDVYWPARMQKLAAGPLTEQFQPLEIWLDGGHNAHGAQAIASIISDLTGRTALIVSMLETKDASAYFEALKPTGATILACPLATSQASYQPAHLVDLARASGLPASAERSFEAALSEAKIKGFDRAVICGSLYTAGAVLQSNNEAPS